MKTPEGCVRRRSARLAALCGLSMLPLMAGPAWAGGPTGGVVAGGSATISTPSGSQTVINQTSGKAIIDWSSFSIDQGGSVRFNNGSGATLNRVTGGSVSSIDGLLSASGSVYLLNPNGVIIGKTGVVNVGGSFVASTLDVSDSQFLGGGALTFAGSSTASVVNYGKVGALGGDVALIAAAVDNEGQIAAAEGSAGLIAGYRVTLTDGSLDQGRFSVQLGGSSTSVVNAGAVQAALVELRANGGNIYALAGNAAGVIQATGVAAGGGKVFLVAEGGALDVEGDITARGPGGTGGQIETSASTVKIGAATIDAGQGGSWLLDPNDLTIDQTAANTIMASLNGGTSVTEQTTASGTGGSGDITLAANASIHWSTSADLTFSAYRNIVFGAGSTIDASGTGTVILYADNTGTGVGTVSFGAGSAVTASAVSIYYDPSVNPAGSKVNGASYANPTENFAANVHGALTTYFLVNTVYDLQNINNDLSANYALGRNIDASITGTWNSYGNGSFGGFRPIGEPQPTPLGSGGTSTPFTGIFDGQGRTISSLYIDQGYGLNPTPSLEGSYVGLFGATNHATVRNLTLANLYVEGDEVIGGLIGQAVAGSVTNVSVAGSVVGYGIEIGGLIGQDLGVAVANASSSAKVSGLSTSSSIVGGLIGDVGIYYASPTLGASGPTIDPSIVNSSATGSVTGPTEVGGLVGILGSGGIQGSYSTATVAGLDFTSLGVTSRDVGGLVGYNQGAIQSSYATGAVTGAANAGGLVGTNNATITASYATGEVGGTATFGGQAGGLVGDNKGAINASYATGAVSVSESGGLAGGLVGNNEGTIVSSYATGAVSGFDIGGLVGVNMGAITSSYAMGEVNGLGDVGGLVGFNDGGSITTSFATGLTQGFGPLNYAGGLVGQNEFPAAGQPNAGQQNIIGSYWDSSTTGQSKSSGFGDPAGGMPLTTSQFQAQLPSGFSPSVWGQIAGKSYPYFLWQYPTAPGVISGTVYVSPGGAGVKQASVEGLVNGTGVATVVAGADGYYYILTPPGSLQNADVLTAFLYGGAQNGNAFAQNATGAATGMNIFVGSLNAVTSSTTLSGFAQALSMALGSNSGPYFLFTVQNGALTPAPGAGLYLTASGPFTVDQPLSLGTSPLSITAGGTFYDNAALSGGTVTLATTSGDLSIGAPVTAAYSASLNSAGGLSEWGSGALIAAILSGSADGTVWLAGPNQVYEISGFTNGYTFGGSFGGFGFADTASLVISGTVNAGSGQLWLTDSHYVIFDAPTTSGYNSFVSAVDGIRVNAPLQTGLLQLYAGNGGIVEVGGTIATYQLVVGTSGTIYLPGANLIGSLSGTASGELFVTNAQALTIGPLTSGGQLIVGTTSGELTTDALVSGGTVYLYGANGVAIGDNVTATGSLSVQSLKGNIGIFASRLTGGTSVNLSSAGLVNATSGGAVSTPLLNVNAVTGILLNGPNQITTIGTDYTVSGPNQINH